MGAACACPGFEDSFEQFLECCSASQQVDADAEMVDEDGHTSLYLKGHPEALLRPLWLLVASFNAGDEAISLNDTWIPRKGLRDGSTCYDLIVVAVQEGILGGSVRFPRVDSHGDQLPPRHCNELLAEFLEHLGQDFRVVTVLSRGAMALLVFAWRYGPPWHNIETAAENTGVGHVFPNKGGLLAKLEVGGSSLCFIAAHLAAHTDHVQRRNEDVAEILAGTKVSGMLPLDAPSHCHHSFFFGDLNYRLDLPKDSQSPKKETDALLSEAAEIDYILRQIHLGDYRSLLQYDQLHQEMANGRVLQGFVSAVPSWPPTYRVMKGEEGFHFDTQRVPSYCDRVLKRSLPGYTNQLQLHGFHAASEVSTSDHKPVSSVWSFTAAPVLEASPSEAKDSWIRISSLSATLGSTPEGFAGLQLRCRSLPKVMEEVVVKCSTSSGSQVVFGGITLDLKVAKSKLDAVHLLLELSDVSENYLGVAVIHCGAITRFEAPILCYGELKGQLRGVLTDVSPKADFDRFKPLARAEEKKWKRPT